jgi:hypothetical protein
MDRGASSVLEDHILGNDGPILDRLDPVGISAALGFIPAGLHSSRRNKDERRAYLLLST